MTTTLLLLVMEFFVALALAFGIQNIGEWILHNVVLHKLGTKKDSMFHYHWEHHNRCRKNNNFDHEYADMFHLRFSPMIRKELLIMTALTLVVSVPLYMFVWPALGIASAVGLWYYFFVHAFSHVNLAFGEIFLPWHWDHHMGRNQNQNWCVSFPWLDHILGTRDDAPPPNKP